MIKLPIFLLVWLIFIAIKLPTAILGLIVVPLLWGYRADHYDDLPWWSRPWANPEDWTGGPQGVDGYSLPAWWINREGHGLRSFWKYHAIRNPANGLRSFEWLDLDIDRERVEYWTPHYLRYYEPWFVRTLWDDDFTPRTYGYICWQGWQAGVKFVHHWNDERHLVFKFGWRVEPRDAYEDIDPDGIRVNDSGFASKFLPYRKG